MSAVTVISPESDAMSEWWREFRKEQASDGVEWYAYALDKKGRGDVHVVQVAMPISYRSHYFARMESLCGRDGQGRLVDGRAVTCPDCIARLWEWANEHGLADDRQRTDDIDIVLPRPRVRMEPIWGACREYSHPSTGDVMPKTQIFQHGEMVSVVTDAAEERDFIDTFADALAGLKNGANRKAIAAGFDIVAKLRGYKSPVMERRVLAAGRWPHPTEKPIGEAGDHDDTNVSE